MDGSASSRVARAPFGPPPAGSCSMPVLCPAVLDTNGPALVLAKALGVMSPISMGRPPPPPHACLFGPACRRGRPPRCIEIIMIIQTSYARGRPLGHRAGPLRPGGGPWGTAQGPCGPEAAPGAPRRAPAARRRPLGHRAGPLRPGGGPWGTAQGPCGPEAAPGAPRRAPAARRRPLGHRRGAARPLPRALAPPRRPTSLPSCSGPLPRADRRQIIQPSYARMALAPCFHVNPSADRGRLPRGPRRVRAAGP